MVSSSHGLALSCPPCSHVSAYFHVRVLLLPTLYCCSDRGRITPHLFRYTSSCSAWEAPLEASEGPYMMVAPPHGVLPIGNVVTMLSFPMLWGFHFRGLTTDAALR